MNTEGSARFGLPGLPGQRWNRLFGPPREVLAVHRLDRVIAGLEQVEARCRAGQWAVLVLAHEAAPALDPAMAAHPPGDFPLLWAAFHDRPLPPEAAPSGPARGSAYRCSSWTPLVDRAGYDRSIAAIRELIRQGEVYQVNYTLPFQADFEGDARAWHLDMARRQGAGYPSWVDMGRHLLLGFSPELFFRRQEDRLCARPMKGTMPRGRFPAEDEALRRSLAACPKNRAENVMIADLVRSDLGRVSRPGTVEASGLFRLEDYPTLFQMTSRITARALPGTGLVRLMAALFPCGSVTGAPKIRAMQAIRDLEPFPRGPYCGAVGYVAPGGDCVFSVPIRTVVLDTATGLARFGVGGGVTHDSTAGNEYRECKTKMAFLRETGQDYRLLETLRLANGRYWFLDRHLERLGQSARRLGFRMPAGLVLAGLRQEAARSPQGRFRVRLLLARNGEPEIQRLPLAPRQGRAPLRLALAPAPVSSRDLFLFHKTTRRSVYETARQACPQADEVVLWNERGEITEACTANLVLDTGRDLLTPALESGLLAGVLRGMLLDRRVLREAVLKPSDLAAARSIWLINSVRGWTPAQKPTGIE